MQLIFSGYKQTCTYLHRSFRCWGSNLHGEADMPSSRQKDYIIYVSIGRHYICTIHNHLFHELNRNSEEYGDAYCFGSNEYQQTEVPLGWSEGQQVATVKAGDYHTCAVGREETTCWGRNDHGQLEVDSQKRTQVAAISVRNLSTCFISKLVLTCFGKFKYENVYYDNYQNRFVMLLLGYNHVCFSINETYCDGDNEFGQVDLPKKEAKLISMGSYGDHSCGSDYTNGNPVNMCWGRNDKGQTDISKLSSINFTFSTVGEKHSCFVKGKNYVECIGTDELGLNQVPSYVYEDIQNVDAGGKFTCAIIGGVLNCAGKGSLKLNNYIPKEHFNNSFDISTGFNHVCSTFVKLGQKSVWACWSAKPKENAAIQPPSILSQNKLLSNFLSSGFKFTCITVKLLSNTSLSNAFCWGINDQGQTDIPVELSSTNNVISIETGIAHVCAATSAHRLFCWGRNDQQQATIPNSVGYNVSVVGVGYYHSCAVNLHDQGECWGFNGKGQTDIPKQIGFELLYIVGGGDFSCGLKAGYVHRVYCWGGSGVEQVPKGWGLGLGKVTAGMNHACILTESGKAKCWGDDQYGQSSFLDGVRNQG